MPSRELIFGDGTILRLDQSGDNTDYTCDKLTEPYVYTYKSECMQNWKKLRKLCSPVNCIVLILRFSFFF